MMWDKIIIWAVTIGIIVLLYKWFVWQVNKMAREVGADGSKKKTKHQKMKERYDAFQEGM